MVEMTSEQNGNDASLLRRSYQHLLGINIYSDDESLSVTQQLMATRLNLIGLFCSIFILIMVRGFTPQTGTVLVATPTLAQFDQFRREYPLTLSCSCSQINIPYNTFLSFTPQYHQICSSDFVTQTWISSLFDRNKTDYYPLDFRLSASSQFQIIQLLCRIASQSVSDALLEFGTQKMISTHALSRDNFQSQIESFIQKMKTTMITNVLRMDQYLELNIAYNDLISSLRSNYYLIATPGKSGYATYVGFYLSKNYKNISDNKDYSSCYTRYNSTFYSGFYPNLNFNDSYYYKPDPPPLYSVPGILAGCLPRFSIMQSTLECFFDSNCLNIIQSLVIGISIYHPLNSSISSRFSINDTIGSMFNELLIEEWHNNTNFTSYFQTCAPISCSYTYTERFSIIYIITNILGLLGGLTMAFKILVSLLVKHIMRRICRICCHQIHTEQEEPITNNRNLWQTAIHYLCKARDYLLTLNVFDKSILLSDIKQKIWATRIYLILLVFGTISLTLYSSITPHLHTVTIENPSRNQFEAIYAQYSLTLSCPCTQLSTVHSKIMSVHPHFHQICSSDFIRADNWLSYFDFIQYNNSLGTYVLFSLDFRLNAGSSLFRIMKVLCEFANETVFNALIVFNNTQFVSNNPLTTKTFDQQTSTLINQFQKQTLGSFLSLFSLIRATIEDNQFHTSIHTNLAYNYYIVNNTYYIGLQAKPYPNTTCTCLTSNQCLRPQGFYCRGIPCYQQLAINQTIPGLVLSCIPINSLLLSTFECFYNQSCIQVLLNWRLFGYESIYQPLTLHVTPLNSNLPSQYSPKTKLGDIISQLLIEEWVVNSDAAAHYAHCQPKVCTYTYVTRFEVIYVVTTVIALFGGLSVILRLIIPLAIRILMQQIERRRQLRIEPSNQIMNNDPPRNIPHRSLLVKLRQSINDVEIFYAQINNSIWTTRIYFSLLFMAAVIILIFTAISRQARSYTIHSPSQSIFEAVYKEHSIDRLSCLCSQSSIEYRTFLSLSVKYHQVCSSDFVLPYWWKLIASRGSEPFYLLDQPLLSNHFRTLSSLCILSQQTVNNSINSLISNTLISVQALSRNSFENQIQSTIDTFIRGTPIKHIHTLEYIIDTFRSNQLEHLFLSSWRLDYTTPAGIGGIVVTRPLSYNNDTCICATSISSSCFWPMIYKVFNTTINITLPGFVGGCLPIDGLQQSTLQCLFDFVCLDMIRLLINNTIMFSIPNPLNSSLDTRYPHKTTKVDTLIKELFIEEWLNTTDYSAYYEKCSPRACYYVETEHSTFIYTITLLLGLYGGMAISIRFIVTYAFKILIRVRHWWHT